jgi:hypothetical protein
MGVSYTCIIIQISQSGCYVAVFLANNSAMKVCFIKLKYMKGNLLGVSSYNCLCHIMLLCYYNLILDETTLNMVKELFFYKISRSVFCLLFSIISYANFFLWTCFIFRMFIYEFLFFTLNVSFQFKQSKTEYLQQNFPRSLCVARIPSIHTRLNRRWECLTQVWETVFFRIVEKII